MQNILSKKVLIVQSSLLALDALKSALAESGAKVVVTTNLISAFSLIEREPFDAVIIDKGLHNQAIDLCEELRLLDIPYVVAGAPHEMHKPAAQRNAALDISAKISALISSGDKSRAIGDQPEFADGLPPPAVLPQRGERAGL